MLGKGSISFRCCCEKWMSNAHTNLHFHLAKHTHFQRALSFHRSLANNREKSVLQILVCSSSPIAKKPQTPNSGNSNSISCHSWICRTKCKLRTNCKWMRTLFEQLKWCIFHLWILSLRSASQSSISSQPPHSFAQRRKSYIKIATCEFVYFEHSVHSASREDTHTLPRIVHSNVSWQSATDCE